MKKFGLLIFGIAVVIGVLVANFFSFGRFEMPKFVNISWGSGIRGSGNVVTEDRGLSGFNAIKAGGVFNIEVAAGRDHAVQVETDDNLQAHVKAEVIDGVLVLSTTEKIKGTRSLTVRVSAPDIESVRIYGASKLSITGVNNGSLKIETVGASKVTAAGETADLEIEVSGASKIDAGNLRAQNARVEANGASSALVNVTGDLNAKANGASKVKYTGTPRNIEKHTSGASKIVQD